MIHQNPYESPTQPPFAYDGIARPTRGPELSAAGKRGKSLIRLIITTNIALGLFVLIMVVATQQWHRLGGIVFRFLLTVGTAYALWNGDRFTRYLYAFAGVLLTLALFVVGVRQSPSAIIGAVFIGYVTLRLAFSAGVTEFLAAQRARQIKADV